jgi:hypothetical protein
MERLLLQIFGIHTFTLLSLALVVGSAVNTSLKNLIFALELVLKLVFEFKLVRLAVLRSLTRLEGAELVLV